MQKIPAFAYPSLAMVVALTCCGGGAEPPPPPPPPPPPIEPMSFEEAVQSLELVGLEIHWGDQPPGVTGSYFTDSLTVIFDDANMYPGIVRYTFTFAEQTEELEIEVSYTSPDIPDQASGMKGSISGQGSCFSIYIQSSGMTGGCANTMLNIYSGCLEAGGISPWQHGLVMMEKSDHGDCDYLIPVRHRRLVEEHDGLAALQ